MQPYPTEQTHASVRSLYSDRGEESRYNKSRSYVMEAISHLRLTKLKDKETRAYITYDDVQLLDKYVEIRTEQGRVAAKDWADGLQEETAIAPINPSAEPSVYPELMAFADALIKQALLLPQETFTPVDTLAPQRQLTEAAENGWVLSTGQVREILGVKSWNGGDRFGFSFMPAGKVGPSKGWTVGLAEVESDRAGSKEPSLGYQPDRIGHRAIPAGVDVSF